MVNTMDLIKRIAQVIIQYTPDNSLLEIFYYSLIGLSLLLTFRLFIHLLIRLVSWRETSSQPFKLRFDEDYDYVNGWRKNPDDSNIDSDGKDKGGC